MDAKENELTRWTFQQELLKIPAKCRKLTSKTSKQKVNEIWEKYEFLISYSERAQKFNEKEFDSLKNVCQALKTGSVKYINGFFLVSEILRISVEKDAVIVHFKNGKELSFVKEYAWLKDLF